MKKDIRYLKYILKHKWFVLLAGLKIGAPLFRLLTHDLSKFLPSEWIPYRNFFYGGYNDEFVNDEFDTAWLYHQHRNEHHGQYGILKKDNDPDRVLEIPKNIALEMVADGMGAGKAITGRWEVKEWYYKNRDKIVLNNDTRKFVERVINNVYGKEICNENHNRNGY